MRFFMIAVCLCFIEGSVLRAEDSYELPPQEVVDIIDAAPAPLVDFSPDRKRMLFIGRPAMPTIKDISRRMLRLAGMRIDPASNSQFQSSFSNSLELRDVSDPKSGTKIALPDGARVSFVSWSHLSNAFVYGLVGESGTSLWLVDCDEPTEPVLLTDRLSTIMGGVNWYPDGKKVLVQTVPENRGDEPVAETLPTGPRIQESIGVTSPTRTFQDLLQNPRDEELFEYYAKTQLVNIDFSNPADGQAVKIEPIGKPAIYAGVEISPDGKNLLVTTVKRPFSYLMTVSSFPRSIEVWDSQGNVLSQIVDVPLAENIPIEGVRTGPRSITWMTGRPSSLVWMEALDGGDPNQEAEFRDAYLMLSAPFTDDPVELVKTNHRAYGLSYLPEPSQVMTLEYDRDRRWIKSLIYDLDKKEQSPKVATDRSIRDRYGDPGRIVNRVDETGHAVAIQDGEFVYRIGTGASPEGDLPFIDRQSLDSMQTERLWRCEKGTLESVVAMAATYPDKKPTIVTRRQSTTNPPNYFMKDLEAGTEVALTDFKDPTPQIRGITKQLVTYQRSDGVPLSATLYLPADYKPGTRLPLLVWAYPREFNDPKTAGQIAGSEDGFVRIAGISHLSLLTQGYAIMDNAAMPVIGDPEKMNDTFIDQIVDAAKSAIDKAVEMGVADRNRVGVGGHSYGAFMTANLLAHCDLFKAGVARSGAYNRTLTPFGFQSERRSLWDAKSVYFGISPFMHANKIQEPLLLVHGEEDNNSGTFPIQSKRMYQAIKGNGGTVRLVMLPEESHGYRARESVMHTQAEMINWFDRYVKNASESESSTGADQAEE